MIRFRKINFKRICVLVLSGVVLISVCGCSARKDRSLDLTQKSYSRVNEQTPKAGNNEQSVTDYSFDEQEDSINNTSEETEKNIEEDKDSKIISFFENIDDKITEKSYQVKDELVKDYKIAYDFIFNDGTIKGYTFDELKDKTKAKVTSIYLKIDEKIESHFPDYKDTIKEKAGYAKDKVKSKLTSLKKKVTDYIKEEVGEDKYNSWIDTKDKYVEGFKEQVKDDFNELKELGGKAKEKIKSWMNKN